MFDHKQKLLFIWHICLMIIFVVVEKKGLKTSEIVGGKGHGKIYFSDRSRNN